MMNFRLCILLANQNKFNHVSYTFSGKINQFSCVCYKMKFRLVVFFWSDLWPNTNKQLLTENMAGCFDRRKPNECVHFNPPPRIRLFPLVKSTHQWPISWQQWISLSPPPHQLPIRWQHGQLMVDWVLIARKCWAGKNQSFQIYLPAAYWTLDCPESQVVRVLLIGFNLF